MAIPLHPRRFILQVVPSNLPIRTANADRTILQATNSDTESKSIRIEFPGTYTIRFELTATSVGPIFGTIYRNGIAIGTQRSVGNSGTTAFFENIGGWEKGDACQLFVRSTAGTGGGTVRGFGILGEQRVIPPPVVGGDILVDTNV